MNNFISVDFETRSTVDLRRSGVYPYAQHPTTEVWCVAYMLPGEAEPRVWRPGDPIDEDLAHWAREAKPLRAWNAQFERVIWNEIMAGRYGWPETTIGQWYCTAADARAMSLPGQLGQAADALGTDQQKDTQGANLMMRMSRPRKVHADGSLEWWDVPDRVQRLIDYCKQDVRTELEIKSKIHSLSSDERRVFELDQTINDRGVRFDRELATAAKAVAQAAVDLANQRLRTITGGAVFSISAVSQMVDWIRSRGVETDSVAKAAVKKMLASDIPDDVRQVLTLREEAGKSSVAKIEAMFEAACRDDRIRGLLMYHGASTGRWSGRLVQPQNFPRGAVSDPERFIPQVLARDVDSIDFEYPVLDVISSMLRPMLTAAPGHKLVAADFSAIEARVLAWLADEPDLLSTFRDGGDVYKVMASKIYSSPVESISKSQRQMGKSCLAGDTKVLTDRGTIRLDKVTRSHKVWDGENWVRHGGLVFQGRKETITHSGLTATPDHLILTESGWVAWRAVAASRRLFQRSLRGTPPSPPCPTKPTEIGSYLGSALQSAGATLRQIKTTLTTAAEAFTSTSSGETTGPLSSLTSRPSQAGTIRRWIWTALTMTRGTSRATSGLRLAKRIFRTVATLATWRKESESWKNVYDITNAGPNHRFTVLTDDGPIIVHNCILGLGYGMGAKTFVTACRDMAGVIISADESKQVVDLYRASNPAIVGLWRELEAAAMRAVEEPGTVQGAADGRVAFKRDRGYLWLRLPSGRRLCYSGPILADRVTPWGSTAKAVRVWGVNSVTRKWQQYDLYSGLITENVVQAIARDVLVEAMQRAEGSGFPVVLSVHDEVVTEVPEEGPGASELEEIMNVVPDWAPGLPLASEGWSGFRYRK